MALPNFFHQSDPQVTKGHHSWHFCYLHGAAEDHNGEQSRRNKWADPAAPDLFVSDQPMPTAPGEYPAMLYGLKVVAVLAGGKGFFADPTIMRGRVGDPEDADGMRHCRSVPDWR